MIDSLQLKNILDSLSFEMTMETDSLGLAISQPIVEAMGKTNWWMWGITAFNACAFIFLTIIIIRQNIKLNARNEDLQKRNLKMQLYQHRYNIYDTILDALNKSNFGAIMDIAGDLSCNDDKKTIDLKELGNELSNIYNKAKSLFLHEDYSLICSFIDEWKNWHLCIAMIRGRLSILNQNCNNTENSDKVFNYFWEGQKDSSGIEKRIIDKINESEEYSKKIQDFIKENNFIAKIEAYIDLKQIDK